MNILLKNSVGYHEHLGYRFVGEFKKCGYKFKQMVLIWFWMEKIIGEHKENAKSVINI